MDENLIHTLIPHQGCVITRTACFGSTISIRKLSITPLA
jgi:hypothetical protein